MTEPTQEQCGRIVEHEVYLCVTGMVEQLHKHEPEMLEELDHMWVRVCDHCGEHLPADAENVDDYDDDDDLPGELIASGAYKCSCGEFLDADQDGTEPVELYEWWAVSSWLADHLETHGHVVNRDCYGLIVWGRPTTGQAIKLDGVIVEITRALHEAAA